MDRDGTCVCEREILYIRVPPVVRTRSLTHLPFLRNNMYDTVQAIGKNNMCAFRLFLVFLFGTILFDVMLVVFLSLPTLTTST